MEFFETFSETTAIFSFFFSQRDAFERNLEKVEKEDAQTSILRRKKSASRRPRTELPNFLSRAALGRCPDRRWASWAGRVGEN